MCGSNNSWPGPFPQWPQETQRKGRHLPFTKHDLVLHSGFVVPLVSASCLILTFQTPCFSSSKNKYLYSGYHVPWTTEKHQHQSHFTDSKKKAQKPYGICPSLPMCEWSHWFKFSHWGSTVCAACPCYYCPPFFLSWSSHPPAYQSNCSRLYCLLLQISLQMRIEEVRGERTSQRGKSHGMSWREFVDSELRLWSQLHKIEIIKYLSHRVMVRIFWARAWYITNAQ